MINRVSDILGFLAMFWREEWGIRWPASNDLEQIYEDEFRDKLPSTYPYIFNDQPLFQLSPWVFASLANRERMEGEVARKALGAILSCLQMRRTMATQMEVNNDLVRIGDDIPPYKIVTVELGMTRAQELSYTKIYNGYKASLSRPTDDGGPTSKTAPTVKDKGLRNMRIHRRLGLATFDLQLETFCNRTGNKNLSRDVQSWFDAYEDHGLTIWWNFCRPDPHLPPYIDRFSMGEYMAAKSPKLQYLCGYLAECLFAEVGKHRVLLYVNWPIVHWELEAFLKNLGLDVLSLRSGQSNQEKQTTMNRFNDAEDQVDVLIADIKAGSVGVNLQDACARLMLLEVSLRTAVIRDVLHFASG